MYSTVYRKSILTGPVDYTGLDRTEVDLSGMNWTVVMFIFAVASFVGHNPTHGYVVGIGILNQR